MGDSKHFAKADCLAKKQVRRSQGRSGILTPLALASFVLKAQNFYLPHIKPFAERQKKKNKP